MITGCAAVTVSVRVALPVPPPLVAPNVTVEVAAAVGVPEIKPVEVFDAISLPANPLRCNSSANLSP